MSRALTVQAKFNDMRAMLAKAKNQIGTALPASLGITPDRIIRVAVTCLRQNPNLINAEPASFIGAVMQAAQMGLEMGGPLGQAYPVPYKGKVQFILGYKGMITLAYRSGMVKSLSAHKVCENDTFDFTYGIDQKLEHKPNMTAPRGESFAYYSTAQIEGGGFVFQVMPLSDIEIIRDGSSGYKAFKAKKIRETPWDSSFDEMAKKTVLRRMFKFLPISVEMTRAIALDEMADAGVDQGLGLDDEILDLTGNPDGTFSQAEDGTKSQAQDLKDKLKKSKNAAENDGPPFADRLTVHFEENGLADKIPALLKKLKAKDISDLDGKYQIKDLLTMAASIK